MSEGPHTCGVCGEDFVQHCVNLTCPIGYWCVRSTHPEEVDLEDDEGHPLEKIRTKMYDLGKVSFAEDLVDELFKKAGELFAQERDEEANNLRKLAQHYKKIAVDLRKQFNLRHHPDRKW